MKTMNNHKPVIARVSNRLAIKGKIGYTKLRQLRIMIGAISCIDPFDETRNMEAFLSNGFLRDIVSSGSGKISKSADTDIELFSFEMIKEGNWVEYPMDILNEKGKAKKGVRVIFQDIKQEDRQGISGYCFYFHNDMRPDFQNLMKNYLSFGLSKELKSGASFRFSMALLSYHNQCKAYREVTEFKIELQELRRILNLEDKYPSFDNLRRKVVERIVCDINKMSILHTWYKSVRTGRKVSHLIFYTKDGERAPVKNSKGILGLPDFVPTETDVQTLSKAKLKAYKMLIEFGVKEGIAFRQIVNQIEGSEAIGFEDIFIKEALSFFKTKAKKKNAGAFTTWWTKKKAFDTSSDVWAKIMEGIIRYRKKLEKENGEAFQNRMVAKEMTDSEFKIWLQNQDRKHTPHQAKKVNKSKNGMQSLGSMMKEKLYGMRDK